MGCVSRGLAFFMAGHLAVDNPTRTRKPFHKFDFHDRNTNTKKMELIFKNEKGEPLKFYIRPCSEKTELRKVIQVS